jgi:opacity protein-like surface antigen
MKRLVLGLLATLLASACLVSVSFAGTGPYMSVGVGGTWVQDADSSYKDPAFADFNNTTEFDLGFNVAATAGFDFGPARLEGEIAYRQNDIDKIEFAGFLVPPPATFGGDVSSLSFMANGFWDIPTGSPATPYLGGGIGVANVSANDFKINGDLLVDDDDTVFAYQLGAGIAFELNPNMALDLGYRFFATADPEFTDFEGDKVESEYMTHNASLGLRIMF